MNYKLFYTACLVCCFNFAIAQKKPYSIFVGQVNGVKADKFDQQKNVLAGILKIGKITAVNKPIEFRLYERYKNKCFTVVTVLSMDSSARFNIYRKINLDLCKDNELNEITDVKQIKADSVFSELITHPIFSLPSQPEAIQNYHPFFLKNDSLFEINYSDYSDKNVEYIVEYKVGNLYGGYSFDGTFFSNTYFADNAYIKAYIKIILLLGSKISVNKY